MNDKLYAFWEYDQPPYFLGGEISKMADDGSVETTEFGRGSYFTPVKIVPAATGRKIKQKLEEIKTTTNEQISDLRRKAYKDAKALLTKE